MRRRVAPGTSGRAKGRNGSFPRAGPFAAAGPRAECAARPGLGAAPAPGRGPRGPGRAAAALGVALALPLLFVASRATAAGAPRPDLAFEAIADPEVLEAGGFERVGGAEGVEVFRREPASGPPPVFLLRAGARATPRTVLAVVEDTGSFLERARGTWIREAAPLGSGVEPGTGWRFRDLYSRIRLPRWLPFRDREQVVRLWTEELGGERFRVRFAVLPEHLYAARLEALRGGGRRPVYVPRGAGAWEIAPAAGGGAVVAYRIRTDPGGRIARGIAERRQLSQVGSLLRAFVREAERREAAGAERLAARGGP